MKNTRLISLLFVVAALYDGLLGAAFLMAGGALFAAAGVPPPNHLGYVHFPAAILLIFGIMFAAIARDPVRRRDLIPYGMLLKISYCGVVLFHWLTAGLPFMWKPFCFADLAFLLAFFLAWRGLRDAAASAR